MDSSIREKEHLLALKVMRLTKPSLMVTQPLPSDEFCKFGNLLSEAAVKDLATVPGLCSFGLGELLTLPQNFGNIFLGETFSCYISVHNDSSQVCRDILVKADLQTSSQRITLSGAVAPTVIELNPNSSTDEVIHHEVKELGTHILVCAVSYTTHSGEKLYFRKFFKFQVLKPLDVKTKFYNAESDEVYLEAQIQNITPGPIYMERVNLEPSQQYSSYELNYTNGKNGKEQVFGEVNYINPLDIRQYLYCLTPKAELYNDAKFLKGVSNIGKLDIVWKTNMGEKGRLQTSALQRVAPGYGDIRLSVDTIPDAVALEKTFQLVCKVINCCDRAMDLVLSLQNTIGSGIVWFGISGKHVGHIAPNASINLELSLLATKPGLQTISGLRLTDTCLKRTYEHDDVAQIFVYRENEE